MYYSRKYLQMKFFMFQFHISKWKKLWHFVFHIIEKKPLPNWIGEIAELFIEHSVSISFVCWYFSSKKDLDLLSFTEIRRVVWWGSLFPSCKYPSAFTYGPIKANNNLGRAFPLLFPRYLAEKKCHGRTLRFLSKILFQSMQFILA